ncbi:MAG: hypothetical protein LBK99_17815 [Opitutaceae bacterium]|jgi:hypothetical protein|nr:hypothetical protein [Opitutaceae bacterium]
MNKEDINLAVLRLLAPAAPAALTLNSIVEAIAPDDLMARTRISDTLSGYTVKKYLRQHHSAAMGVSCWAITESGIRVLSAWEDRLSASS